MIIAKKFFVFFIGFLCAWVLFSTGVKIGTCQANLSPNVSFSADSSNFYFLDRDESKIYKYNTQGKLTHVYTIKELGEDLLSK
jgi:hypothetical protein